MTIIFVVFLSIYYSSHHLSPSINKASSIEIKQAAAGLSETVFNDIGIPSDWQWRSNFVKPSLGSYIYRVDVHLSEWNGTSDNYFVSVFVDTDENAYNSSIIVYDGNQTVDTELKDIEDVDSDGFLEGVNITFEVFVPSNEEKIINIFYSRDNMTSVSYQSLIESENTLNVTSFLPEKRIGLTESKLSRISNISLSDSREKFGLEFPFLLRVRGNGIDWSYGYNNTGGGTSLNERKLIYQNSTGHIKSVSAIAYVWR